MVMVMVIGSGGLGGIVSGVESKVLDFTFFLRLEV